MNFLAPAFLLGLPLVAVPVVIHLLNRRQRKRIGWGAMRFLAQAATRKRRIWRVTDWLLLLLRVAALLFFVLALARPLFPSRWLHGAVPREVILVLDRSLSMTRRVNGMTLFESQRAEAERLLGELTGSDTVRVMLAGESPEWLTPDPVPARSGPLRRLREQLAELKPTLGGADLVACVREAAEQEAPKDRSARVVMVLSDGQRFGWRTGENDVWAAVGARLEGSAIPTTVGWRWVGGVKPGPNLAVNRLDTPRPHAAMGASMAFTATVQNHGPETSPATLLGWRVDDQPAGVTTVPALGPGATTTLTFAHPFARAGTHEVACVLEGQDELAGDDEGRCLVDVYERLPVLVVAEPRTGDPASDDASFLLAALGATASGDDAPGWRSVFLPTVVAPDGLAGIEVKAHRAVILADVATVSPAVRDALGAYVREGGGLWLTLGARTEAESFNAQWFRGGAGLAPLKLEVPVGDATDRERFMTVRASSEAHPATALLADFQRLDLDRARVYRRHAFDPGSARDVSVLLQAQGGEPVVVERKLGRGRVLVQGVPLGVSWSTLPLCQAYVALVHEWLWYLCEPDLPRRNLTVGESLAQAAPFPEAAAEATLTGPDGAVQILRAAAEGGRGQAVRSPSLRAPGRYEIRWKGGGPAAAAVAVADGAGATTFQVLRRPEESNLAELTAEDRAAWAGIPQMRGEVGLGELTGGTEQEAPKHPLEGWLLAALPLVLLGEMAMAGWTTQRRHAKARPVAMPEGAA